MSFAYGITRRTRLVGRSGGSSDAPYRAVTPCECAGCRLVDVKRSAAIIELDDTLPAPGRARLRRSAGIGAVWRDGEVLADDDQAQAAKRESWMPGGAQSWRPST